jgi:hypothetical protein
MNDNDQSSTDSGLISAIYLSTSNERFDQEKIEGSPVAVSCIGCACLIMFTPYPYCILFPDRSVLGHVKLHRG